LIGEKRKGKGNGEKRNGKGKRRIKNPTFVYFVGFGGF
jgi:hypothetical protein